MKTKTIFGLFLCIILAVCLYVTPSTAAASAEEEVLQVAKNYVTGFNTSDFELISSLWWHSPKTTFFGVDRDTPFLYRGWEEIEKSLKETANVPAGTFNFSMHHPEVTMLEDNISLITLYHNLVYTDPNTKVQTIEQSRQTMVLQKILGKWLIVHVHISLLPKG